MRARGPPSQRAPAGNDAAGAASARRYAIALSLRNKQKVVYTSPLKALSNQKFRELTEEFGDVGLMTGDVSINQHAACMVMARARARARTPPTCRRRRYVLPCRVQTTEILRSMGYRGGELLADVGWVIFDEARPAPLP